MERKPYHHGDLRRALIETGIEVIGVVGEDKLSLRKVAEKCGVSNAAPYSHFGSKDEFLAAIQQHIMDEFTSALEHTAEEKAGDPRVLSALGKAYVMFFYKNPLYFDFLFSRKNIAINLSANDNAADNPPLSILQKTAASIFGKAGLTERVVQNKVIAMWALVHGLSAIAIMPNTRIDGGWVERIGEIISSIAIVSEDDK